MASLWSGVKLQDVKTQLALRGHSVPDEVILAFLQDAASSSEQLPSTAVRVGSTCEDTESDTASVDTCSEQEGAARPDLSKVEKNNLRPEHQPRPASAAPAARREDVLSESSSEEASRLLCKAAVSGVCTYSFTSLRSFAALSRGNMSHAFLITFAACLQRAEPCLPKG